MRVNNTLKLFGAAILLASCSYRSPDVLPCMCENPDNTLGLFPCVCGVNDGEAKKSTAQKTTKVQKSAEPQEKIVVRRKISKRVAPVSRQNAQVINRRYSEKVYYVDDAAVAAYENIHHIRDDFASLQLAYVDFRLRNGDNFNRDKLGNYRFRIFGCRRESKNVFLNEGRAMEKDMRFFDIFFKNMNPVYPVVVDRNDKNFADSDRIKTPEYILTAEITDYFMNICDEYDWDKAKKKIQRTGTSEITVTWRVMDLCRNKVYWKGTTTGYGEVNVGEPNGETLLVERAFAEALNNLTYNREFEQQMLKRVTPEQLMKQQRCFDKTERAADTFQCQYKDELLQIERDYIEYDSPCVSRKYRNNEYVRRARDYRENIREVCREHRCNDRYEVIEEELPYDEYELDTSRDIYIDIEDREDLRLDERSGFDAIGSVIEQRGGVDAEGSVITIEEIEEESGGATAVARAVEQRGGIEAIGSLLNVTKTADDYWVEIQQPEKKEEPKDFAPSENSIVNNNSKLCIMAQAPYTQMNAENIYRLRKAVLGIENAEGKKGAGLLLSKQFVLTSADLLNKENNRFEVKTINGRTTTANAVRVNPNKNVALLLLDEEIPDVRPLPLTTGLPEVNKDIFMTFGVSDLEGDIEGYIGSNGKVTGYRYSPDRGAEILVSTSVQDVTLGGALVDRKGNIAGIAHSGKKSEDGPDLFIPIETALEALDVSICGDVLKVEENSGIKEVVEVKQTPKSEGVAEAIDSDKSDKAPTPMTGKEKK
ncbi:MAG: trypsin-like peptidase domain-containing protein [Alphaproteobacteria bacterium]|nr:trypsin-like peptidase domain-containing protein [Alphaproteobacteria bacterium]